MSDEISDASNVTIGSEVYSEDGSKLGTIRGFDSDGFFVTTEEGIAKFSVKHERSGHDFGEAELMWRCTECGEMGDLEGGIPDECPNCGAPKEGLYYWTED